jgi:hypothetical protein
VLSAVSQQVQAIQVRQTPSPAFPPHVCTRSALLAPLKPLWTSCTAPHFPKALDDLARQ